MNIDTIFEKIIRREIPAKIVYEDDFCLAFHDIQPQAPIHILLIPKKKIQDLFSLQKEDQALIGHLMECIPEIAKKLGIREFRLISNCGSSAGQSIFYLHFHLLGGREFSWPPG